MSQKDTDDIKKAIAAIDAIKHSERMCMSSYDIYESDIQDTNYI